MLRLAELPPETVVHPGHTEPTTIGEEREDNPFVRIWRGVDPEGEEHVTVWDREATLVLWAPDYDGTNKAWMRFADDGATASSGGRRSSASYERSRSSHLVTATGSHASSSSSSAPGSAAETSPARLSARRKPSRTMWSSSPDSPA